MLKSKFLFNKTTIPILILKLTSFYLKVLVMEQEITNIFCRKTAYTAQVSGKIYTRNPGLVLGFFYSVV